MPKGYLAFVLHAHLPYVFHPEYDSFLEERWFFEAMTETYIPFVKFFDALVRDQVPFKITLSISPSLLAMMENEQLQERYHRHLDSLIELAGKERERTRHEPHFHWLAGMYHDLFVEARDIFVRQWDRRISRAFRKFYDMGVVDLITTSATHGLLPLLSPQPRAVQAQIRTGLGYFQDVFGFSPKGMWLPECAYYQGVEKILAENDVRFFLSESHGIENADMNNGFGVYQPLYTSSGVAVFGRDQGVTQQVWSADLGFPGHPDYREFYRDIGHEREFEYIKPYIEGDIRVDTCMKYYRITARHSGHKEPYQADAARERAAQHAEEFMRHRISHIESLAGQMNIKPIIVAPFDAELFGHWWFEGPQWLNYVIRKAAFDQDVYELVSLSDYLDLHPVQKTANPAPSSWGCKGYFETWINGGIDWMYPQLYECTQRLELLADRHPDNPDPVVGRALNQCVRELLLAQSSDWPFMITNQTSPHYAARRFKDHIARFHCLADAVDQGVIDTDVLSAIEAMDDIFPRADYRMYRKSPARAEASPDGSPSKACRH